MDSPAGHQVGEVEGLGWLLKVRGLLSEEIRRQVERNFVNDDAAIRWSLVDETGQMDPDREE